MDDEIVLPILPKLWRRGDWRDRALAYVAKRMPVIRYYLARREITLPLIRVPKDIKKGQNVWMVSGDHSSREGSHCE